MAATGRPLLEDRLGVSLGVGRGPAVDTGQVSEGGAAAAPLTGEALGVGRADPEALARAPDPEPGSLEDLIGRREARGAVPWTRALWLLLVAALPILGAAGYALSREAGRARLVNHVPPP
jgi:hypothetical protein